MAGPDRIPEDRGTSTPPLEPVDAPEAQTEESAPAESSAGRSEQDQYEGKSIPVEDLLRLVQEGKIRIVEEPESGASEAKPVGGYSTTMTRSSSSASSQKTEKAETESDDKKNTIATKAMTKKELRTLNAVRTAPPGPLGVSNADGEHEDEVEWSAVESVEVREKDPGLEALIQDSSLNDGYAYYVLQFERPKDLEGELTWEDVSIVDLGLHPGVAQVFLIENPLVVSEEEIWEKLGLEKRWGYFEPEIFQYGEGGPYVLRASMVTNRCGDLLGIEKRYDMSKNMALAIIEAKKLSDPARAFCMDHAEYNRRKQLENVDEETDVLMQAWEEFEGLFEDEYETYPLISQLSYNDVITALEMIEQAKDSDDMSDPLVALAHNVSDDEIEQLRGMVRENYETQKKAVEKTYDDGVILFIMGVGFSVLVLDLTGYEFTKAGSFYHNPRETVLRTIRRGEEFSRGLRRFGNLLSRPEFWRHPVRESKHHLEQGRAEAAINDNAGKPEKAPHMPENYQRAPEDNSWKRESATSKKSGVASSEAKRWIPIRDGARQMRQPVSSDGQRPTRPLKPAVATSPAKPTSTTRVAIEGTSDNTPVEKSRLQRLLTRLRPSMNDHISPTSGYHDRPLFKFDKASENQTTKTALQSSQANLPENESSKVIVQNEGKISNKPSERPPTKDRMSLDRQGAKKDFQRAAQQEISAVQKEVPVRENTAFNQEKPQRQARSYDAKDLSQKSSKLTTNEKSGKPVNKQPVKGIPSKSQVHPELVPKKGLPWYDDTSRKHQSPDRVVRNDSLNSDKTFETPQDVDSNKHPKPVDEPKVITKNKEQNKNDDNDKKPPSPPPPTLGLGGASRRTKIVFGEIPPKPRTLFSDETVAEIPVIGAGSGLAVPFVMPTTGNPVTPARLTSSHWFVQPMVQTAGGGMMPIPNVASVHANANTNAYAANSAKVDALYGRVPASSVPKASTSNTPKATPKGSVNLGAGAGAAAAAGAAWTVASPALYHYGYINEAQRDVGNYASFSVGAYLTYVAPAAMLGALPWMKVSEEAGHEFAGELTGEEGLLAEMGFQLTEADTAVVEETVPAATGLLGGVVAGTTALFCGAGTVAGPGVVAYKTQQMVNEVEEINEMMEAAKVRYETREDFENSAPQDVQELMADLEEFILKPNLDAATKMRLGNPSPTEEGLRFVLRALQQPKYEPLLEVAALLIKKEYLEPAQTAFYDMNHKDSGWTTDAAHWAMSVIWDDSSPTPQEFVQNNLETTYDEFQAICEFIDAVLASSGDGVNS